MLSHHVQPVSVPTRVTGVRDAPDLEAIILSFYLYTSFGCKQYVWEGGNRAIILVDPKVPAALDGYVQCRGHVREGLASKVILHTA